MISAGVEGQIPPYMMTYHPERWGAQKQEFVRPAPRPLPSRFNGVNSSAPNGTSRLAHSHSHAARPLAAHHHHHHQQQQQPPAATPVNLTAHGKDDAAAAAAADEQYYAQSVFAAPTLYPYTFPNLYQQYPLLRTSTYAPPLSPLETYSPTTPTGNGTFLPPQVPTFSPPTAAGVKQSPGASAAQTTAALRGDKVKSLAPPPFKVPSGKEGSMKHRILTRPEDGQPAASTSLEQLRETRKRIASASATVVSPPRSPAATKALSNHHHHHNGINHNNNNNNSNNNNNDVAKKFSKGSLIQLADGKLRNVEDMRTEDFLLSADMSPELRLAESTVVKIAENPITNTATITLSYNQRRAQVEVESTIEHPFFVFGRGWASCHVDRTLKIHGLEVHRLHVGDVLVSLMPREKAATSIGSAMTTATIVTTASSTVSSTGKEHHHHHHPHHPHHHHHQQQQQQQQHHQHLVNNLIKPSHHSSNSVSSSSSSNSKEHYSQHGVTTPMSPDSMRKRRWSAPDQICDEDEQLHLQQQQRRMRVE